MVTLLTVGALVDAKSKISRVNTPVPIPAGKTLDEMVFNYPAPPPEQGAADALPTREPLKKILQKESRTLVSVSSTREWKHASDRLQNLRVEEGHLVTTGDVADFQSRLMTLDKPAKLKSLTLKQSTDWMNWNEVPNVGPDAGNAPVLLPVGDKDYYFFAQPAGSKYHAFHSTDMKNWKDCGSLGITWMTTAEYSQGTFYLYYDAPNDQDPHLMIDDNLQDDRPPVAMGVAFRDPSSGSDIGVMVDDADDEFHIVYEDWSPIKAQAHAWDSPLAGHTSSPDGFTGFEPHEHRYAVDQRTTPTGKMGRYHHKSSNAEPHQAGDKRRGALYYEIHEPMQEAYGDWTIIKVGTEYYLFGDHDPVEGGMGVARFHSSDFKTHEFTHQQTLGNGHPDPSVGFAEGQFYLITQMKTDYVSPGPWVEGVSARVGVDANGNGRIDSYTDWTPVQETYALKEGYCRVVEVTPAALDLSGLPEAHALQIELRIDDSQVKNATPRLSSLEVR